MTQQFTTMTNLMGSEAVPAVGLSVRENYRAIEDGLIIVNEYFGHNYIYEVCSKGGLFRLDPRNISTNIPFLEGSTGKILYNTTYEVEKTTRTPIACEFTGLSEREFSLNGFKWWTTRYPTEDEYKVYLRSKGV